MKPVLVWIVIALEVLMAVLLFLFWRETRPVHHKADSAPVVSQTRCHCLQDLFNGPAFVGKFPEGAFK